MKKMLIVLSLSICSLACSLSVASQDKPSGRDDQGEITRSPWAIGAGAIVSDSPYAGENTRVNAVPLISYQGERFFVRGVSFGYQLIDRDGVQLDLRGRYRFAAFEVDELGQAALAENGIDARLLEDRDGGIDLGFGLQWSGQVGVLELEALADATADTGGHKTSLAYSYPFDFVYGTLSPSLRITRMSDDLANDAYGTLPAEVARGVIDYRPGASTIPELGLTLAHPLSRKWFFLGSIRLAALPDRIQRSPLIAPGVDHEASMMWFFTRGL